MTEQEESSDPDAPVLGPVRPPSEMRGFAARNAASIDAPATALLSELRNRDRQSSE